MIFDKKYISKFILFCIKYEGNLSEVSRNVNHSNEIIQKYIKQEGFDISDMSKNNLLDDELISYFVELSEEEKTPVTEEEVPNIIELYKEYDGNFAKADKQSDYPGLFIKAFWMLSGLYLKYKGIPINKGNSTIPIDGVYRVLELDDNGENTSQIWQKLPEIDGLSTSIILKILRSNQRISSEKQKGKSPKKLQSRVNFT